ncbi:MAG: alpha/beta hydrolase [Pseudomonadota bacterium]
MPKGELTVTHHASPQPMVFLPGLFEPACIWSPMRRRLGRRAETTLSLQLPGHTPGDTEADVAAALQSGAWFDDMAARLRRAFGSRPAVIVGHSTGGMIGLALARRHPDVVHSIVLVGGLTSGHRDRKLDLRAALVSNPLVGRSAFLALWRSWLSTPTLFRLGVLSAAAGRADLPNAGAWRNHLLACDPMAILACTHWVLRADLKTALAHIDKPILAFIGRSDPIVPAAHQLRVLRATPNAQGHLMAGGHLLFIENPEHLERGLRAWLAQAEPPLPHKQETADTCPRSSKTPGFNPSPVRKRPREIPARSASKLSSVA